MFKWLMVFLLLLFVYHVREVFPPFIVGAIIAYLLYPLVKFLHQRCGWAPFWAVLIIYAGTGTIIGFIAWHWWPVLADQATNLFEQRRETVTNLVDQVAQAFNLQLDVHETSDVILGQLQNSVGKPEEIMHFGGVISKSLLSILVCAVTSVYMLVDNKRVGRFFMRFIAPEKRATVVSLAGQMDVMFRKYVLGQIGLITLMSVIAFCILSCFHIKYALLIALVTGFLEIIPVLGPLLAIIIASVFAVAQLGIAHFWVVPLCYWIARLVEDYIIVPNTIGHAVELHPLAVIFAVVVGETMAGALGMLIAIPVAASIKVVLDFCYPPASPIIPHQHDKNPLAKMFKSWTKDEHQDDPLIEQKLSDLHAIESMHEASKGTGSPRTTSQDSARMDESEPIKEKTAAAADVLESTQSYTQSQSEQFDTLTKMAIRARNAADETISQQILLKAQQEQSKQDESFTELARKSTAETACRDSQPASAEKPAGSAKTNSPTTIDLITPAKPQTPAVKPDSSAAKSQTPVAKAELPGAKSAQSTTANPTSATSTAAAKSASPSANPATPVAKSTAAAKNEAALSETTPEPKPDLTAKSALTNAKPEAADSKEKLPQTKEPKATEQTKPDQKQS